MGTEGEVKEQKLRAELRERYIRLMSKLTQKEVKLNLHEKTCVEGTFAGINASGSHFAIDMLKTPIGIIDHAVIRSNDAVLLTTDMNGLVDTNYRES